MLSNAVRAKEDGWRLICLLYFLFLVLPILGQLDSLKAEYVPNAGPSAPPASVFPFLAPRPEIGQSIRAQPVAKVSDHLSPQGDNSQHEVDQSQASKQLQTERGSLPPVRSLQDWKVESLVLLASVDGCLHARDRQTGEPRWVLEVDTPMVQTSYSRVNVTSPPNRHAAEDFLWIVEPTQDGALYMYRPAPRPMLQKLGITVKVLAEELSPHAREDPAVVYTAEKKNTLYTLDARTGTMLQVFSSAGTATIEDAKCPTAENLVPAAENCGSEGTLTIGRIEYTVNIQSRVTQKTICQLKYWEWSPNTRDSDLQRQYATTTIDKKYIYSMHDGKVIGFDHGPTNDQRLLYTKKLDSPVIRVFDIVRAVSSEPMDYPLVLLPQPSAPTDLDFHPQVLDGELGNVFVNCTKQGGWYAMSEQAYPLVTDKASTASCYDSRAGETAFRTGEETDDHIAGLIGIHRTGAIGLDGDNRMLLLAAPDRPLLIGQGRTKQGFLQLPIGGLSFIPSTQKIVGFSLIPLCVLLVLSTVLLRKKLWFTTEGIVTTQTDSPSVAPVPRKVSLRVAERPLPKQGSVTPPELTSSTFVSVADMLAYNAALAEHDATERASYASTSEAMNIALSLNGSAPTPLPEAEGLSLPGPSIGDEMLAEHEDPTNEQPPDPSVQNPEAETTVDRNMQSTHSDQLRRLLQATPPGDPSVEPRSRSRSAEVRFSETNEAVDAVPIERRRKRGARGGAKRRKKDQLQDQTSTLSQKNGPEVVEPDSEIEEPYQTDVDTVPLLPGVGPEVNGKPEHPKVDEAFQINDLVIHTDTPALGYGSHGTVVYRGHFGGREVAVKRMLLEYFDMYSHEVSLLQESDDHPNVIRYFCRQQSAGFLFIALELCPASLQDVVEKPRDHIDLISLMNTSDVLYQIAMGLRHLHSLKIVHRDIKPQNILVAEPKRTRTIPQTVLPPRILISDFGLCKKLEGEQSSFRATTAHAAGTSGWRAPELLVDDENALAYQADSSKTVQHSSLASPDGNGLTPNRRATRAIDIFSLGCVFFYVLSAGMHPFGDKYTREMNIIKSAYSLTALEALGTDAVEAKDLVAGMLSHDARKRPDANVVLTHPFFWSSEKRLNFLVDVSDHFEWEPRDPPSPVLVCLERSASTVIGADFLKKLDRPFVDTLGKQRKYTGTRLLDLLRALRNKKNHYQDMPDGVKAMVGALPDGYSEYWRKRFPKLVMHCWRVVQEIGVQDNARFKNYFRAPD